MAKVEWSFRAREDLERLRAFLNANNPRASTAATALILLSTSDLREFPLRGRPLSEDEPEYREFIVPFSNSGYVVLYRFDDDTVEILAVKHMREAGYRSPT
jgi:plasmid stabilization system protein ParE